MTQPMWSTIEYCDPEVMVEFTTLMRDWVRRGEIKADDSRSYTTLAVDFAHLFQQQNNPSDATQWMQHEFFDTLHELALSVHKKLCQYPAWINTSFRGAFGTETIEDLLRHPDPDLETKPDREWVEQWLRDNIDVLSSDDLCVVYPIGSRTSLDEGITYFDEEERSGRKCSLEDHIQAWQMLSNRIGKTVFVGGLTSAKELEDPGNWDGEVVDVFWQLVYRRDIRYG